jgi:hypothetical protein
MLQVFHLDVAKVDLDITKVDLDVAYMYVSVLVVFIRMLQVFSSRCYKVLQWLHTCCSSFF